MSRRLSLGKRQALEAFWELGTSHHISKRLRSDETAMLSFKVPVLLIYQHQSPAIYRAATTSTTVPLEAESKETTHILHQKGQKPIFNCVTLLYFGIRVPQRRSQPVKAS